MFVKSKGKLLSALIIVALVSADFLIWSQTAVEHTRWCQFSDWWQYDPERESLVSIVRSDDSSLDRPVALTDTLDYEQIAQMVEKAIELAGGLESKIPSYVQSILIKPNIVEGVEPKEYDAWQNGKGVNTDPRVVKAIVLYLFKLNPGYRIIVAEGAGGWALPGTEHVDPGTGYVSDGYSLSYYKGMIEELQNEQLYPGLNVEWVDLNYDEIEAVSAATPRLSDTQTHFYLPETVVDADFFINVPVLKIHNTIMTVGLKNYVGVLPGMVYGWPKSDGYNGNGKGLDHSVEWLQKNFVDVARTVGCDFVIVDATVGKEKSKTSWGKTIRRNIVVAGDDIVSVDAVCARLMGLNPDDVEHITMAGLSGLGQYDLEKIEIAGSPLDDNIVRHIKSKKGVPSGYDNSAYPNYGQGCRTWLFNGPYFSTDMDQVDLPGGEETAEPTSGKGGWGEPVYFYYDLIDPAACMQDTADCVYYAFTYFEAAEASQAQLWVGSDGDMKVWINGEPVYDYDNGVRTHRLPNDVVNVNIAEGINSILVKLKQTSGICRFNLNICEIETDKDYLGNRLAGVKFSTVKEPNRITGDCDGNNSVDIFDLLSLLRAISDKRDDSVYDCNDDSRVDIFDLLALLRMLGQNN